MPISTYPIYQTEVHIVCEVCGYSVVELINEEEKYIDFSTILRDFEFTVVDDQVQCTEHTEHTAPFDDEADDEYQEPDEYYQREDFGWGNNDLYPEE